MEPVRFGLVGYGFGGRYFHAPLIGAAAECEFLGVVTTSPERQALVAQEHPAARTFASLAELRAAGAEAVAISTPAETHTTLSEQALELGLAVVCDKPFALDAPSADGRAGRAPRAVAGPVSEPALGLGLPHRPRAGGRRVAGRARPLRVAVRAAGSRRGTRAAGGGTLLDFGAHLVDQALVLLGPVAAVHAEWRLRDSGLDDDVFVALAHTGGARSHLWGSWPGSAGAAVPGHRHDRQLRERDTHGHPGGPPARRADARHAGRGVGGRATSAGAACTEGTTASPSRPNAGAGTRSIPRSPGRCGASARCRSSRGRRRHRDRPGRRPPERDLRTGRPAARLTATVAAAVRGGRGKGRP